MIVGGNIIMNAELWSYPDEESCRRTLKSWLRDHNIPFNEELETEELRQLYVSVETGRYKKTTFI